MQEHFGKSIFIWSNIMSKYVYQKFLLNCDYENVKITDCSYYKGDIGNLLDYRCDYCLFDIGKNMIRN